MLLGKMACFIIGVSLSVPQDSNNLTHQGFSYGTILGATVAAMFPDRIGRMILDGAVNLAEWFAGT